MQLTTSNGTQLDSEELAAPAINSQIKRLKIENLMAVTATFPDGVKEYVLIDIEGDSIPIYSNGSLEAVGIWLELLAHAEKSSGKRKRFSRGKHAPPVQRRV